MKWIELKYWEEAAENKINSITTVAGWFEIPLSLTKFDKESTVKEWKKLKNHVKVNHKKHLIINEVTSVEVWQKIIEISKTNFSFIF